MNDVESKPNFGRIVLSFLLLPLLLGLESWAYWAARSILPLYLSGQFAMTPLAFGSFSTVVAVLNLVALLIGGGLGLLAGPSLTLMFGAVLSVGAYAALWLSHGLGGVWTGVVLLGLGQGLFRPSLYALAVVELPFPREQLRSTLAIVLYAALNVAALTSGMLVGPVASRFGVRSVFGVLAGAASVMAFLSFVFALVWFVLRPKQSAPAPREAPRTSRVLLGAGVLVLALVPYNAALSVQHAFATMRASAVASFAAIAWVHSLNPIAVITTALVLTIVAVVLHVTKKQLSALYVIAAGLCFTGIAFVPALLPTTSLAAIGVTEIAIGSAEVFVGPFAQSRMGGDVPARYAVAVIALYQLVAGAVSLGGSTLLSRFASAGGVIVGGLALAVFITGIALGVAARPLVRALYLPPETSPAA